MKTMYEVNWHYNDDGALTHVTVTPIRILREGILPGCSAPSITAIAADGNKFLGSVRDYYSSEAEAWASAKEDLTQTITSYQDDAKGLLERAAELEAYVATMGERT